MIVVSKSGWAAVVPIVVFDALFVGNTLLMVFVSESTNFIVDVVGTAFTMNVADSEMMKIILLWNESENFSQRHSLSQNIIKTFQPWLLELSSISWHFDIIQQI